jgi:hypothetical protein
MIFAWDFKYSRKGLAKGVHDGPNTVRNLSFTMQHQQMPKSQETKIISLHWFSRRALDPSLSNIIFIDEGEAYMLID